MRWWRRRGWWSQSRMWRILLSSGNLLAADGGEDGRLGKQSEQMPVSNTKRVLLCWGIGTVAALAIAGAASVAPSIFGILTLPFWFLTGLAGFGGHDIMIFPLG